MSLLSQADAATAGMQGYPPDLAARLSQSGVATAGMRGYLPGLAARLSHAGAATAGMRGCLPALVARLSQAGAATAGMQRYPPALAVVPVPSSHPLARSCLVLPRLCPETLCMQTIESCMDVLLLLLHMPLLNIQWNISDVPPGSKCAHLRSWLAWLASWWRQGTGVRRHP